MIILYVRLEMKIVTTLLITLSLALTGCSDRDFNPKVQRILNSADITIIEIPIPEPIAISLVATVNGSNLGSNGSRRFTEPMLLESDAALGVQVLSEDRLGVFVSDGGSDSLKWILDDIGPIGSNRMIGGPNKVPYTGGPRIIFNSFGNPDRGAPRIQVFLVSDPSLIPHYDVDSNSYEVFESDTPSRDEPMHQGAQIFVNNHRFGNTNGCSGPLGANGSLRCGHESLVSEIDWRWLGWSGRGDLYSISRVFPADTATESTERKVIEYMGEEIQVWRDEIQRIVLRPIPEQDEPNDADNPVNSPENPNNHTDG